MLRTKSSSGEAGVDLKKMSVPLLIKVFFFRSGAKHSPDRVTRR